MSTRKSLGETMDEAAGESSANRHVLSVMDPAHGDLKTVWDPDKDDEVASARDTFDRMKKKGYSAFRVGEKGKKAELMHEFDADAAAVIMAPPIRGG